MKRVIKILKLSGILILVLVAGISIITASRQHVKYEAPYPDIKASSDSAVIARGKHLVFSIAHCAECHSTVNVDSILKTGKEIPLSGGREFPMPLGTIYSRNITSDKETGIGKLSDAEIARALYYGVHPDGTAVYDFMPFHNVSKKDMTAIISYLRTQKPVKNEVPAHKLNIMGKIVNAFLVKPIGPNGPIPDYIQPDTSVEYGKYLVMNVANCGGCHTKRSMSGAYTGEFLAGGSPVVYEEGLPALTPPNLTTDSSSRIFSWNFETFKGRMKMGKLISYSHMPWNSFKHMTDDELKAIYNYLKSVKPAKS